MSEDILKMIDAINSKEYNDANDTFNGLIAQKLDQALEQEKVSVASSVFGGEENEIDQEVEYALEVEEVEEEPETTEYEDEDL